MKINKITAFFLAFLMIALIFPVFGASADTGGGQPAGAMDFEQALSALRSEFFNEPGIRGRSGGLDLTPVYMDDSDVIHTPPEYLEPIYDENYTGTGDYTGLQQNYIEGSTRNFRAQVTANSTDVTPVLGKLVKQGSHVNLWVLDKAAYDTASGGAANDQCALEDIADDTALLNEIAAKFDGIFEAMTEYFGKYKGVKITTHFGNMPAAGDIDNDGRVNILMYNIRSKPASGSPYTAGFFSSGDFFNDNGNIPISLFHMDIARDYGYRNVTGTPEQKVVFYDTFAHEFQHLLFYMYFGVYAPNVTISEYSWFNESLSELAGTFYSQESAEVVSQSRIISSAENSYANASYGDFLRFNNSFKNYGMSNMHSALMHKKTNGTYIKNVYNYFKEFVPLSATNAAYNTNRDKITDELMTSVVGSAFAKAELNDQLSVTGSELFDLLYFIFMENFASDGGKIIVSAEESVKTSKFHSSSFSAFNLWGIRPAFGASSGTPLRLGAIYSDDSNTFTDLSGITPLPTLPSGGSLSLTGYSSGAAASHDMLYRLTGVTETEPFLNISIADNNIQTRYYAVIPGEAPETQLNRQRGKLGADVYPLAVNGAANFINTNGRPAYLFVSTLQRNVSGVQVIYSWTDTVPVILGDVNGDGKVNIADIIALARHIADIKLIDEDNAALLEAADVNVDGRINIADLIRLARYIANVDPSPLG
ncbi:MAG: dockerin type I repeat-containing protein [Oscillospiraceae bacterium]|nr:dockerin type I repeat-containing protein [Oscillospiraceae bacterium]